jgi:hypothetical protein
MVAKPKKGPHTVPVPFSRKRHTPVAKMNHRSNVSVYVSVYICNTHAQAFSASLKRSLNLSANEYYYYYDSEREQPLISPPDITVQVYLQFLQTSSLGTQTGLGWGRQSERDKEILENPLTDFAEVVKVIAP